MYLWTCSLLDNNNLSGYLPDELAEMPSLKLLYDCYSFMLCVEFYIAVAVRVAAMLRSLILWRIAVKIDITHFAF